MLYQIGIETVPHVDDKYQRDPIVFQVLHYFYFEDPVNPLDISGRCVVRLYMATEKLNLLKF